jgi:hypothetical protein
LELIFVYSTVYFDKLNYKKNFAAKKLMNVYLYNIEKNFDEKLPFEIWINNNIGFYLYIVFFLFSLFYFLKSKDIGSKKIIFFLLLLLLSNYIRNVFVIDEVMIGLENPYNFIHHNKFSYSPKSMIDGSSDLFFLALLIPFAWTKEVLMHANYIFCFVLSGLTFVFIYKIFNNYNRKIFLFILLLLASSQFFIRIWTPGFPSTLIIPFIVYGIYLLLSQKNNQLAFIICFFPLIRPDAILFSVAFFFTLLIFEKKIRYKNYLGCILCLAAYFLIVKLLYGHYKPTPMEYKSYPLNQNFLNTILPLKIPHIISTLKYIAALTIPSILLISTFKLEKIYKMLTLAIPFSFIVLFYAIFGMNTHWGGRYMGFYQIYLFLLYSLIILEIFNNTNKLQFIKKNQTIGINIENVLNKNLIVIVLIFIYQCTQFAILHSNNIHRNMNFKNMDGNAISGQVLSNLIPNDWKISTTEINYIGYFMHDREVIDLVGYTNKTVANSNKYNYIGVKIDPFYLLKNPTEVYWQRALSEKYSKNHLWIDNSQTLYDSTFENIEKFVTFDFSSPEEYVVDMKGILKIYDIFLIKYKEFTIVTFILKEKTNEFKKKLSIYGQKLREKKFDMLKFNQFYKSENIKILLF